MNSTEWLVLKGFTLLFPAVSTNRRMSKRPWGRGRIDTLCFGLRRCWPGAGWGANMTVSGIWIRDLGMDNDKDTNDEHGHG